MGGSLKPVLKKVISVAHRGLLGRSVCKPGITASLNKYYTWTKSLLFLILWGNMDVQCQKFNKLLKNNLCKTLKVNTKASCLICWTTVSQKGKATQKMQAQEPG